MNSSNGQPRTLAELLAEKAKIDEQLEQLKNHERKEYLIQIRDLIDFYEFTPEELFSGLKSSAPRKKTTRTHSKRHRGIQVNATNAAVIFEAEKSARAAAAAAPSVVAATTPAELFVSPSDVAL